VQEEKGEDKVESDESMNVMLARSEEELVLFAQMDKDRAEADKEWMNSHRYVISLMKPVFLLTCVRQDTTRSIS
jgi:hypothetical protein